jgi:hypothetical protein
VAAHLAGECGLHGVGDVRRCCCLCWWEGAGGDEVFEMFPAQAGLVSAANRERLNGRLECPCFLTLFERSLVSRVWLVAAGDVHVRRMPVLWLCYDTIHLAAFHTTARKPLSDRILRWSVSLAASRKRNAAVQSITL